MFLLLGIVVNAWAEPPVLTPAEKIVVDLAGGKFQARRLSIPEAQTLVSSNREEVITVLRQVATGRGEIKTYGVYDSEARMALLKLNDRPTIEKIMASFREFQTGKYVEYCDDIEKSAQPLLIPELAPYLFIPHSTYEAYERERLEVVSDVAFQSPAFLADWLIIQIVRNCDQFSEATRDWARAMWRNSTKREQIRKILQAWWSDNKQLLQSGKFGAVKPGDPPPEDKPQSAATPKAAVTGT